MLEGAATRTANGSAALDAVIRQLCVEEGCAVWVDGDRDTAQAPDASVLRALGPIPLRFLADPALRELAKHCRRLFVRQDGMTFRLVLLRCLKSPDFAEPMTLDALVEHAAVFLDRTGTMSGNKIPVGVEVIEIHRAGLASDYAAQIAHYQRRGVATPKVAVAVVGLDASSGEAIGNAHGLGAWRQRKRMRRALSMSLADCIDAVRGSGFRVSHALLGGALGSIAGVAAIAAAMAFDVQHATVYGTFMVLGTLLGAGVSVGMRRAHSQALAQSLAAGLLALGLQVLGWLAMGGALGVGLLTVLLASGMVCALIGGSLNTVDPSVVRALGE